jgi:hypothetical protein
MMAKYIHSPRLDLKSHPYSYISEPFNLVRMSLFFFRNHTMTNESAAGNLGFGGGAPVVLIT